jgi:hypothetical protein
MMREGLDANFQTVAYARHLTRMRDHLRAADYWRDLNPHLTITDDPFSSNPHCCKIALDEPGRYSEQICREGYLQTPALLDRAALARLRSGIERVVRAGFPSVFACVYDEFYAAFEGLSPLLTPILGDRYLLVAEGFWAFFVDVGDPGYGPWSATGPHRDSLGPDPSILAGGPPSLVNVWIPLTDATPANSCIYVLPGHLDPDYRATRGVPAAGVRLQDVRALPADAGSVLAWTTHLLHWGSRSSPCAKEPRVSIAMYFQSRQVPVYDESATEIPGRIPFETRLRWIARSIRKPGVFDFP